MTQKETDKKSGRGGGAKKTPVSSASDHDSVESIESLESTASETIVEEAEVLDQESEEAREEILGDRFWRLIAMVTFALLAYFALLPFVILAAMQFGVVLMTGSKNAEVHQLLSRLAKYIKACLDYVAYRTDDMPFPFGPLPSAD